MSPPLDELFLCLVSNVSPWTYLGARPVNPSPEASFDTGLDVFALGRMGPVRMLHTLRQTLAREPDARGRGVHRWHDLEELSLTAVAAAGLAGRRRPPGHRDRACGCVTCRPPSASSPEPSLTHGRRPVVNVRAGVWFRRVAGLARAW